MRILVARCAVNYSGRLSTRLGGGERVVLFKDDGAVVVHAGRSAKPVNYMPGPTLVEEHDGLVVVRRRGSSERLEIQVEEVLHDAVFTLSDTATFEREGRERDLHLLLVRALDVIEPGLVLVERERPTEVGPVDLFCRDRSGVVTLVEVKRVRAVAAAVEQVLRYAEQVERDPGLRPVRMLVAAPDFAPQARVLAAGRGVELVRFDPVALRDDAVPELTLF